MNKFFIPTLSVAMVLLATLTSCKNSYYEKHEGVKNLQWKMADVKKFTVDIQDNQPKFNLSIALRHASGVQHNFFTLKLTTTSPSGKKISKDYQVKIKDAKGDNIGEALGDIIDVTSLIEENYTFAEKGKYTFEVIHHMPPNTSLVGIMEVGFIVKKAKDA